MTTEQMKGYSPSGVPYPLRQAASFIIPFTFEAISLVNTSTPKLTLQLDHINEIKNRNREEFVDVGEWSTLRHGIASQKIGGTTNLGAIYNANPLKLKCD
jgi:hypothetical protein